jgi:phosphoribosyl 1,2-cyclic phosphate phosphodiesterase
MSLQNPMTGIVTILGCGSSTGVPLINCDCETCQSLNPKNHRLRTSILIEIDGKKIICDTGPDFRQQALREKIHHLDGIILTHMHFDHIAGIDDTRTFVFGHKKPIPFLISEASFQDFKIKYAYFFQESKLLTAKVDPVVISKYPQEISFLNLNLTVFSYLQGNMPVMGFRIGDFAYITDIKDFDPSLYDQLKGVNTLVISALKDSITPYHLSFTEAVEFHEKIKAKKTYLTHLSHDVNYEKASALLPKNVHLAFDGLKITFDYERKTY